MADAAVPTRAQMIFYPAWRTTLIWAVRPWVILLVTSPDKMDVCVRRGDTELVSCAGDGWTKRFQFVVYCALQ
jgi:hypothetical protein